MLKLTRLFSLCGVRASHFWALYTGAFPKEERRAESEHLSALADSSFHCLHAEWGGEAAGLLTYWHWEEAQLLYVEHLAIAPHLRGQGLGHLLLQSLPAEQSVILEIEPVADAATARRLHFYESAGFHMLPYPHLQLAYQKGCADIPLQLLGRGVMNPSVHAEFLRRYHAGPMQYRQAAGED